MKRKIAIFFLVGLYFGCLARADFVPIDFEGFGFKKPNIEFIMNPNDNADQATTGILPSVIAGRANSAIVIKIDTDKTLTPGLSINVDGKIVTEIRSIDAKTFQNLIGELKNPFSYGEHHVDFTVPSKKTTVDSALEVSDGSSFFRLYFDTRFEYCWFFSLPDNRSSTWSISPGLANALKSAIQASKVVVIKPELHSGQ